MTTSQDKALRPLWDDEMFARQVPGDPPGARNIQQATHVLHSHDLHPWTYTPGEILLDLTRVYDAYENGQLATSFTCRQLLAGSQFHFPWSSQRQVRHPNSFQLRASFILGV